MKDLLKNRFARSLGLTRIVDVNFYQNTGSLTFTDNKSCSDCESKTASIFAECTDKTVLKAHFGNNNVCFIELEKFLDQFANVSYLAKGGKCDLMMYDDIKCVFVELSCLNAKYLEDNDNKLGKKTKARQQLYNTILKLQKSPDVAGKINSYQIKQAIFAYREKNKITTGDKIEKTMSVFNMTSKISKMYMSKMEYGFTFVNIEYPNVYQW